MKLRFDQKWRVLFSVALVIVIILGITQWETLMGTTQSGNPNTKLSHSIVTHLFDAAPTLEQTDGFDHLYVSCTASEGTFCYFVPPSLVSTFDFRYNPDIENETNRIDSATARQILTELDVKSVERAKNNTVLLHCQRNAEGILSCTINGGNNEAYPVDLT